MTVDTGTTEDHEFAQWREQLGQDIDGLLSGEDLVMAAHWLRVRSNDLSETERRLIRASMRQTECETRKTNRVRLYLLGALALAIAASAATAWYFQREWQEAFRSVEQERKDAQALANRSRLQSARMLAATAGSVFARSPSLALLLALEF